MKIRNIFLVVLFCCLNLSQSFGAVITSIGSTTFEQGTGFEFIPVSIFSNNAPESVINYEVTFSILQGVTPVANRFDVFNATGLANLGRFNVAPSLIGWDDFATLSSDGSAVITGFGSAAPTGVALTGTLQQLLFLPVSRSLGEGTYTIIGTVSSINGPGFTDIAGIVNQGTFVVTAVPEPTSILTAAIGFGVVMYRRRRASKALAA